jgi:hypothetical protein
MVFLQTAGVVVCPLTKHSAVYTPVGVGGMVNTPAAVVSVWTVFPAGSLRTAAYVFGVQ